MNQLFFWKSNQIIYCSIPISYLTIKKNQKCTSKTCHIIMPFFSNLSKDTIFYFSWSKVKKKIWNMKFHFSISIWSFCWCVKYQIALWILFSLFLQVFFKSMQSKCGSVSKISFSMTCTNFVDIKIDQLDLARRQHNISKLIQYNSMYIPRLHRFLLLGSYYTYWSYYTYCLIFYRLNQL